MPRNDSPQSSLRFEEFLYEPDSGRLSGPKGRQTLRPQVARLLEALLARPGEVVDRQTLVEAVWGSGRVVEFESGLAALVKELRAALGDQANAPRFIETVPRRGLRFLPTPHAQEQAPQGDLGLGRGRRWLALAALPALAILVMLGLLLFSGSGLDPADGSDPDRPARVAVLPFLSVDQADREQRASLLLADSLIAALGRAVSRAEEEEDAAYAVIGRTSVADYPPGDELLPRLGRELRVDLVVEGSYRQEGDGWLINVSAVKVAEQTILLSRSFVVDALSSQAAREHMQAFAREMDTAVRRCGRACLAEH